MFLVEIQCRLTPSRRESQDQYSVICASHSVNTNPLFDQIQDGEQKYVSGISKDSAIQYFVAQS